jgi:hypothetical protein
MHLLMAASIFRDSPGVDLFFLFVAVIVRVVGVITRYWRFVEQWVNGIRGKDWGPISAVIDVVSVVEQTEQTRGGERTIGYLATLTYFYRNPDLQMGEYCKMFDMEAEANQWVGQLKGRNLMIHVDPRDPSSSVLRPKELDTMILPGTSVA